MTPRRAPVLASLALAASALSACSSGPRSVGARFAGPAAIVPFAGVAPKSAPGEVRAYLAVASSRGDELRILDPSDQQPVLGPGVVFPLSVTTAPRPLLLASATFADGQADLLVAVSAGGAPHGIPSAPGQGEPAVQVIDTWSGSPRVAYDLSLAGVLGPGAEVLTLRGFGPGPGPSGVQQAMLLVGVSGNRLALLRFERAADGSISPAVADPVTATPLLGFDALDIALEPGGTRIFIATRDPIPAGAGGPVQGVAVIDTADALSGGVLAPGSWIATGLDARAPTVALAAARVPERAVGSGSTQVDSFQFDAPPLSVYAVLAPGACGPAHPVNCGVVTLRPDQPAPGLAPDPAIDALAAAPAGAPPSPPTQAYRAPIPVPGFPAQIAVGFPNASPEGHVGGDASNPDQPLLQLAPGTGLRNTPAIVVVSATDGQVYWLDAARFGPVSDQLVTRGTGRSRVTAATASGAAANAFQPGLHNDAAVAEAALARLDDGTIQIPGPAVVADPAGLAASIETWPGFTPDETFQALYQGALPGLTLAGAVFSPGPDGVYAGAQTLVSGTTASPVVLARIGDPELGVRVGDLVDLGVQLAVGGQATCTTTVTGVFASAAPELAIARFPAGFPGFPGGAVRLAPASCLATVTAPSAETAGQVTVRTAGWALVGTTLGYLGRPNLDETFTLEPRDETGLSGEDLAVARKTRRLFYPTEGACPIAGGTGRAALPVGCYAGFPNLFDPIQPGPVVRFRLGTLDPALPDPGTPGDRQPAAGSGVSFTTQRGLIPTFRRPRTGGVLPQGLLPYDRSLFLGHARDPLRFYVPYADDQVLVFSPSEAVLGETSIR